MTGHIRVTAQELQEKSGTLRSHAGNIQTENTSAMTLVTGLMGGWEGAASSQFQSLFQQWKTGADQVQQALDGISQLLQGAGTAYAETEEQIRARMAQ